MPPHPDRLCSVPRRVVAAFLVLSFAPFAPAAEPLAPARVTLDSIVRLTYEHNLRVAAKRYDLESSQLQFQRFIRDQSQFIPFILDSQVDRQVQSELQAGRRVSDRDDSGRVSVGMEKEFFDGTNIGGGAGVRGSENAGGRNSNPFLEAEARVPLFGSFTRLQRTIARTFEESEMFNAWLGFIEQVREAISDSQHSYLSLQYSLGAQRLVLAANADIRALEQDPRLAARTNDRAQLRAQLQSYQSEITSQEGRVDTDRIWLLNAIGLDALDDVAPMEVAAGGVSAAYLTRNQADVIAEALRNDVEIQVLEMGRRNEQLKKDLALKGKWDITGRVTGGYDFESRGDDRSDPAGYRAGVGVSVRRNDPKLLQLSVRQSEAKVRQFEAKIEFRRRQLGNDIRRNLVQAASRQRVVRDLHASQESRRGVYEQKLAAYLAGTETVDNLIQARKQLHDTERDLLDETIEFHRIMIRLNEASGQYFVVLGDAVPKFEGMESGVN